VAGVRLRGRQKKTWKEVVEKDYWTQQLNKDDAVNHCNWSELMKRHEIIT